MQGVGMVILGTVNDTYAVSDIKLRLAYISIENEWELRSKIEEKSSNLKKHIFRLEFNFPIKTFNP